MNDSIKFFFSVIFSLFSLLSSAEKPTSIAREFFSKLNTFIAEDDFEYHKDLIDMCSEGFVISDRCALENVEYQTNSISLDVYLKIMKDNGAKVVVNSTSICEIDNYRTNNYPNLTVVEVELFITSPIPQKFSYDKLYDFVYIDAMGKIVAIGDRDADSRSVNPIKFRSIKFTYKDLNSTVHDDNDNFAIAGGISYLQCNFTLYSNVRKTDTIYHKIYSPKGELWKCSNCTDVPKEYTIFTYPCAIPAKQDYTFFQGFGCDRGGCWEVGEYVWEIWNKREMLGYKKFEIRPSLNINQVLFAAKNSISVRNNYGEKLYNEDIKATYLYAKIFLKDKISVREKLKITVSNKSKTNKLYDTEVEISPNIAYVETRLGDKYMESGDYLCELFSETGAKLYEMYFNVQDGGKILLESYDVYLDKNSLKSKKIKIKSPKDLSNIEISHDAGALLDTKIDKEEHAVVFVPFILFYFENEDSVILENSLNNSKCKVNVHAPASNNWWYNYSQYIAWEPGKNRSEFFSTKIFAGQNWGAELSVFDMRFACFGMSLANFGFRSTFDLNYDVYYAPTLSFVLPIYYGDFGHALYLSAAPTIELYRTRNSPYKPYWFTAELGYKWTLHELCSFDIFVRYDECFSAGLTFHFGDVFGDGSALFY